MVEDRKLAVLRAIVEDYVSTQEPVGSKALVERHQLGVSPATVRNDMAALEDEGFQFEGAEASFELLMERALGRHRPGFLWPPGLLVPQPGKGPGHVVMAEFALHKAMLNAIINVVKFA